MKIRMKLFLFLSIITVIPVIILAAVSYNSYSNLISTQISKISTNTISNSVSRVNKFLNTVSNDSLTFAYQQANFSNSVVNELEKFDHYIDNLNDYEFFSATQHLKFFCETFLYNHGYINGIYLVTKGGNILSYSINQDIKSEYKPLEDEWYKRTVEKKGKLYISDISVKDFIINAKPSISFSRVIVNNETHEMVGVLMLDCNLEVFTDLNKDVIPGTSDIYLVNEAGKIIYDNTMTKIGQQLENDVLNRIADHKKGSFESKDKKTLTVYNTFSDYNWKIVANISIYEVKKEFNTVRKLIIIITITCIMFFLLLSMVFSNRLTKPVSELSRIMKENKSHKLVVTKKNLNRQDEIGILYNEYNTMINEINNFIKESYQNELISLDSQMRALEAQINSHFLYNTLGTINSFAEIEGQTHIATMSQALGDMFRYAIKTESELVTLGEELEHTENYLTIQKIRYGEKIKYTYDIPENLKEKKILKLILQPLIENTFNHGFEGKDGIWKLRIRTWMEENSIFIEVIDNGVGMSAEKIAELDALLKQDPKFTDLGKRSKQSIGIKNVNSRITLYYGQPYGLTIESCENTGTTIKIHIPLL